MWRALRPVSGHGGTAGSHLRQAMSGIVFWKCIKTDLCPAGLQTRWEAIVLQGDLKITPPQ